MRLILRNHVVILFSHFFHVFSPSFHFIIFSTFSFLYFVSKVNALLRMGLILRYTCSDPVFHPLLCVNLSPFYSIFPSFLPFLGRELKTNAQLTMRLILDIHVRIPFPPVSAHSSLLFTLLSSPSFSFCVAC